MTVVLFLHSFAVCKQPLTKMKIPVFTLILILITLKFNLFMSASNECSRVYIVPMLDEFDRCPRYFTGEADYCVLIMKFFLYNCASNPANRRKFIGIFDFNYETYFLCTVNPEYTNFCNYRYNFNHNLYLQQNRNYSIKQVYEKKIEEDASCRNNSIVIYLSNIACDDFKYYPDVDELIGRGLENTSKYLLENNMHGYIIQSTRLHYEVNKECVYGKNLKFNTTNRLETLQLRYYEMLTHGGGNICAKDFPEPTGPRKEQNQHTLEKVIGIVSGIILLFIILFITFWGNQIRRRYNESKIEAFADAHAKSAKHIIFGKYKDEWEVTPKELRVDQSRVLGQGMFGKVYFGHLKKKRSGKLLELDVAVKFTHDHSDEKMRQDMIEEIGFMKALGSHENLLVMVGYVKSIENPVICTVFCSNSDLLKILQKHELHFMSSNKCQDIEICFLLPDLLRLAIEVCNGLCYLAYHSYVHRDIAARNVLLTENMTAKLADFGLCKQLEMHDICIIDKQGKFPVKYMPYESLKFGEFSFKTDVWAYGILLFEMFSGGKKPFDEIPMDEFVSHLENDGKPLMPDLTPQPLIQFLNEKIFQKYPSRRADFKEIKQELCKFHSIVCNVLMEEERNSICGRSIGRSSVRSSVRRHI